jgi:hypothetical protein
VEGALASSEGLTNAFSFIAAYLLHAPVRHFHKISHEFYGFIFYHRSLLLVAFLTYSVN